MAQAPPGRFVTSGVMPLMVWPLVPTENPSEIAICCPPPDDPPELEEPDEPEELDDPEEPEELEDPEAPEDPDEFDDPEDEPVDPDDPDEPEEWPPLLDDPPEPLLLDTPPLDPLLLPVPSFEEGDESGPPPHARTSRSAMAGDARSARPSPFVEEGCVMCVHSSASHVPAHAPRIHYGKRCGAWWVRPPIAGSLGERARTRTRGGILDPSTNRR
jgi:hypothetical protein